MSKKEYTSPEISVTETDYTFNLMSGVDFGLQDDSEGGDTGDDIISSKGTSIWDTGW